MGRLSDELRGGRKDWSDSDSVLGRVLENILLQARRTQLQGGGGISSNSNNGWKNDVVQFGGQAATTLPLPENPLNLNSLDLSIAGNIGRAKVTAPDQAVRDYGVREKSVYDWGNIDSIGAALNGMGNGLGEKRLSYEYTPGNSGHMLKLRVPF